MTIKYKRKEDGFALLLPVYGGDDINFFRAAFLSSTVEQSLKPNEVIIVQDGPLSLEFEEELAKLRRESVIPVEIIVFEKNRGLTEALNTGLMNVSYETVARMDADDVSDPLRFEKQWKLIKSGYDLVGTGMGEFETDPAIILSERIPPVGPERIRDHARTHNPFNHPTVMYKLSAVEAVGSYEEFGKMEDYWLWVRMLLAGSKCENIPEPLVKYRVGAGAYSRRGGFQEARTEWRLQKQMLILGFITFPQFLRNVLMKGVYRLLPAGLKKKLFGRFVAGGLPGDRS